VGRVDGGQYRAVLEVMAFDRSRLLLDVSKIVAEYTSTSSRVHDDVGFAHCSHGL